MYKAYQVTKDFESVVSDYVGSKYGVAVDSCSNALFLCMKYLNVEGSEITIPSRTYLSVPCNIIHAGAKVKFDSNHPNIHDKKLKGAYQLDPYPIWDAALSLKKDSYIPGQYMCLSFSGPNKHLKLGKGGMILTDDEKAYKWFKKARYSGRNEASHLTDCFDMIGWNCYMLPEIAARGLVMMVGMSDFNDDLELEYQDLSKYEIYK